MPCGSWVDRLEIVFRMAFRMLRESWSEIGALGKRLSGTEGT
jgi:hypothetical protein